MNAKNIGEAVALASPYMSVQESIKVKTSINQQNGLTGREFFKETTSKNFSSEQNEIADYIFRKFPENPDVALAIAMAESRLKSIQSNIIEDGKQEESFGVFQIHEPSHKDKIAGRDLLD